MPQSSFPAKLQGWGVAVSMGADMKANAWGFGGGGALEVGDHRLLEDGSKRGGALVSDDIVPDTARVVGAVREQARVNGR